MRPRSHARTGQRTSRASCASATRTPKAAEPPIGHSGASARRDSRVSEPDGNASSIISPIVQTQDVSPPLSPLKAAAERASASPSLACPSGARRGRRKGETALWKTSIRFWFITLVTLLSGAGGTGLGGVVGALCKSDSNRTISLLLAFAGGVMTAMVCFDLLAEAVEAATQASGLGVWIVVAAVVAGVAVVYGLNYVIDRHTSREVPHVADADHPRTHDDIDELIHADHWAEHKRKHDSRASLMIAGVVMACAIALHNVPEA